MLCVDRISLNRIIIICVDLFITKPQKSNILYAWLKVDLLRIGDRGSRSRGPVIKGGIKTQINLGWTKGILEWYLKSIINQVALVDYGGRPHLQNACEQRLETKENGRRKFEMGGNQFFYWSISWQTFKLVIAERKSFRSGGSVVRALACRSSMLQFISHWSQRDRDSIWDTSRIICK